MNTQYDAVSLLIYHDGPNIAHSGEFHRPGKHQAVGGESGLGSAVYSVMNKVISFVRRSQVRIAHLANKVREIRTNLENERVFRKNVMRLSRLSPHLLDDIGLLPTQRPKPSFTPEIEKVELIAKRIKSDAFRNALKMPSQNIAPSTLPVAFAAE